MEIPPEMEGTESGVEGRTSEIFNLVRRAAISALSLPSFPIIPPHFLRHHIFCSTHLFRETVASAGGRGRSLQHVRTSTPNPSSSTKLRGRDYINAAAAVATTTAPSDFCSAVQHCLGSRMAKMTIFCPLSSSSSLFLFFSFTAALSFPLVKATFFPEERTANFQRS